MLSGTPGAAALLLAAVAVTACADEGLTAPPRDGPLSALAELTDCTPQSQLSNFAQYWDCNQIIAVGPGPGESSAGIEGAIQAWGAALRWDALPSIPEIAYQPTSPAIAVSYLHPNGQNTWCAFNDHTSYIHLEGSDCENQRFDNVTALITHEFAEVLGLNDRLEDDALSPADCTIRIQGLTTLNSRPCAQEVEYIFAGYGLTTVDPSNIWNQTVVTGVSLATNALTVEQEHAVTDSVYSIRVDPPGTPPTDLSASQATYNWTATSPNIVLIGKSSGGRIATITGVGPGSTYIRVTAASTSISNGVIGTVARRLGDSVKVTVPTPPPAGTNFRVSDITGPPVPITQAGAASLHAVVEDPFNEYFQVKWDISYSNGSHEPVHSDYYPSPGYTLPVPAGSYRITVTATARSEGQVRSHTSYFPVCTGSGGGGGGGGKGGPLLRAPLPDSLVRQLPDSSTGHTPAGPGNGGAGTDAVGGC
jgi:hypothetical protein